METPHHQQTMRDLKGDDYVAAWPGATAHHHKMHVDLVAAAINDTFGTNIPDGAFSGTPAPDALNIVADLTPADFVRLGPALKSYAAAVRDARRNRCHFCGQDTGGRECRECR